MAARRGQTPTSNKIRNILIMSFIGRGLRFFLVSALVNYFGDKAIEVLRKRFFLITCLIGIFICFIIYLQSMNKL